MILLYIDQLFTTSPFLEYTLLIFRIHWLSCVWLADPKPPTRSKDKQTVAGTLGRVIKLKANYYPITVKSWDKHLFHYDVVIEEPNRGEMDIPKKKKLWVYADSVSRPLIGRCRCCFANWLSDMFVLFVSCCNTYNHCKYVKGFVYNVKEEP